MKNEEFKLELALRPTIKVRPPHIYSTRAIWRAVDLSRTLLGADARYRCSKDEMPLSVAKRPTTPQLRQRDGLLRDNTTQNLHAFSIMPSPESPIFSPNPTKPSLYIVELRPQSPLATAEDKAHRAAAEECSD